MGTIDLKDLGNKEIQVQNKEVKNEQIKSKYKITKVGSGFLTEKDGYKKSFFDLDQCKNYSNKCSCREKCTRGCVEYKEAKVNDGLEEVKK